MRRLTSLFLVALMAALPAAAPGAGGGKKGQRKDRPRAVHGVVVDVKRDADNDNGSITVRVHHKGKGGGKGKGKRDHLRTFQVLPVTKFFVLHEGKRTPSSFKEIHKGEHVVVQPMDDRPRIAQSVTIVRREENRRVRGRVVDVKKDADKDNGWMVVGLHDKDGAGDKDRDDRRKFQVLPVTKFFKVHEGKRTPSSFAELHKGQHVIVHPMDDRPGFAQSVDILVDPR
jgi:hypothetical protein